MTTWEDAVNFCKEHYHNCYNCPVRGACFEDYREDRRRSDEYEQDMIAAIEAAQKMTARE